MIERDHLFVSYATEDGAFAEWLTLRLTNEGYCVWCDRVKLLGGESYPRDIDKAIKERTFRLLAVLSKHSIKKPNPLKERTLALNLSRERGEDFIIPINLDGISSTEIDWMVSDLTYIPFHDNWADGLRRLLKKLESISAPRTFSNGKDSVAARASAADQNLERKERLWSNCLEVLELPGHLWRISSTKPLTAFLANWPYYRENDNVAWVFEVPPSLEGSQGVKAEKTSLSEVNPCSGLRLDYIVTNLLRKYIEKYLLRKGLKQDSETGNLYFPLGLSRKIRFRRYDGKSLPVQMIGDRKAGLEGTRYHISPFFNPKLGLFDKPVVLVHLRLYLTDLKGRPLPSRSRLSRRKRICRAWWNYEWLARLSAAVQWLTEGKYSVNLSLTDSCRITLSGELRHVEVSYGIDEKALGPLVVADQPAWEDDQEIVEGGGNG